MDSPQSQQVGDASQKQSPAPSQWQQVQQTATDAASDIKQAFNPSALMEQTKQGMQQIQQGRPSQQQGGGKKAKKRPQQSHQPQQPPQKQEPPQQSAQEVLQPAGKEAFILPPGTTIILPEDAGGTQFLTTTKSTIKKVT